VHGANSEDACSVFRESVAAWLMLGVRFWNFDDFAPYQLCA